MSETGTRNCRTPKELPETSYLRECLEYDAENGVLFWKPRPREHFPDDRSYKNWTRRFAGKRVSDCKSAKGYLRIILCGGLHKQHRAIWKLVHGVEPIYIDHINGDPGDNRLANLRSVPHAANMHNRRLHKGNKSGVPGVLWYPDRRLWAARIGLNGTHTHLGFYQHVEEAIAVRRAAEREHDFHPNHGRRA